jgi:hypothetical protein
LETFAAAGSAKATARQATAHECQVLITTPSRKDAL